jgi:type IV pilus assembly protein PilW
MSARRGNRGFTLVELLVALVVSAVVVAGALALLVGQRRAFHGSAGDRALQESARSALSEMGMNLRRAGYGVDPWLAFDFGPLTGTATTNESYPGGAPGGTRVACTGGGAVACRDSITGPDELVFYARDPAFSRTLSSAPSETTLRFATALSEPMLAGQILQVMCSGGMDRAYVTVASTAGDLLSVTLDSSASGTFPFEQARIGSGCFNRTWATVRVFRIERFHYYVATFADPGHPTGRPYLMLDRGLTDASGRPAVEPVAPDVEDLQVAYTFRSGTVVGRAAGTRLSNATGSVDLAAVPPAYDAENADPARTTDHPANIRAVQVSVVVRNPSTDPMMVSAADRTIPAAGNRPAVTDAPVGYRRLLVETTAATRNLDSRAPFTPPYSSNSGADGLNVGGG